jgi:hypothetical protein
VSCNYNSSLLSNKNLPSTDDADRGRDDDDDDVFYSTLGSEQDCSTVLVG